MQWSLIKTWAKDHGYDAFREKSSDSEEKTYDYYWGKIDDPSVTGLATSVSKLSTQIYNHMTDNKWVEYQQQFQEEKKNQEIDHAEGYFF